MTTIHINSSLIRGSKLERQFALRWSTVRGACALAAERER